MAFDLKESASSCALREIVDLSSFPDEERALTALAERWGFGRADAGLPNYPFVMFVGVTKQAGNYHNRADKTDYGQALEELITELNLGKVWRTDERENWTHNKVRVWIWAPDYARVRDVYRGLRTTTTEAAQRAAAPVPAPPAVAGAPADAAPAAIPGRLPEGQIATVPHPRGWLHLIDRRDGAPASALVGGTDAEMAADYSERRLRGLARSHIARGAVHAYVWTDGTPAPNTLQTTRWGAEGLL